MPSDNFDPNDFLDQQTDVAGERRPAIQAGDYMAVIEKVETPRAWVGSKDSSRSGWALDITLCLDIPFEEQQRVGLDQPTLRLKDSVFLDIAADGRGLNWAKGKNQGLTRYREATDQNRPGEKFAPRMLEGRPVVVSVKHDQYNGAPVERVNGVARPR